MASPLTQENIWFDKYKYHDAEKQYYEQLSKASLTPLADKVAKARQRLLKIKNETNVTAFTPTIDVDAIKFIEQKVVECHNALFKIEQYISKLDERVSGIESRLNASQMQSTQPVQLNNVPLKAPTKEDDDDVDLFGSESEDDEAAARIKEERLAAYNAKKSKKPVLIAKSNIILDVKPWDDETNMKQMESEVRKIQCEGLLWGAAKLVPLAYGIKKLQISCVVEDDLVSVDWLQEQIEAIAELVQSVDIAAFNKV